MGDKQSKEVSHNRLRTLATGLIRGESTMTLATAQDNAAWAAPVYYVFSRSAFYFFSDPDSRHIRESMPGCPVSAAIHSGSSSWEDIRGIQMSGVVYEVTGKIEAIEAIGRYLKKFGFTRKFFSEEQAIDLNAFRDRFHVRLYKFDPTLIYYLDNSLGFGFRETVHI
ncbi:MAG: pyridoxamine 5'-phosphate oxidase family protein [Deltaproteobacteria bacterium]|nr:pyridoxamine 5'-phosphate oxidase family protein [Deltaproteobacteria bacterium]MBW2048269.1 pyridoxamine 5'-phosphate oxidase family protein [Deltaproteobacteria bacterium]MBW2110001.1 pyridoxamine 5'-phosphate oxidase family protein [Deltaproteobacteria bacterium]MBW2351798.1 pyridoxamine 5'-phosphate oxidase family protein [Deltaproteobacteria bacterium]HDZ89077.1 hypothetical protein [Deltaproteobacteria bacterium]